MKKLLLIPFLMISWLCADMWETSFHQGNTLYHISNKKGDRLELACNYDGGSFSLMNSKNELTEFINVIINDEIKIISPSRVRVTEGTSTSNMSWGNLINALPTTSKFVIESGKDSYTFEPTNFKKVLSNISQSCLEYQNGTPEDTNSTPDKEIQEPKKVPFKLTDKRVYDRLLNQYFTMFSITSLSDGLIINNIIVNKGKCSIDIQADIDSIKRAKRREFPSKLPEYEEFNFSTSPYSCNVLKLEIITNQGSWTFGDN